MKQEKDNALQSTLEEKADALRGEKEGKCQI